MGDREDWRDGRGTFFPIKGGGKGKNIDDEKGGGVHPGPGDGREAEMGVQKPNWSLYEKSRPIELVQGERAKGGK